MPRAMSARISRARGEALCARTKRARALTLDGEEPFRSFSRSGMARSGSLWRRLLMAMSFKSSSPSVSGRTRPARPWPISSSRARASLIQELFGNRLASVPRVASASAFRPSLLYA